MYSLRFVNDSDLQANIDAWQKVLDTSSDNMSVRNTATEVIDALEREQAVRAEYDKITREEVDAFCDLHLACVRAQLDPREVMINMGVEPKRYDAFDRYHTTVGRQG